MNKHIEKQLNDNDFTIIENHVLINQIKNDYIKKNAKQMLNHEELDYCFMNNSKYRYIAVTKANELLAKLLLNLDGNRLCLN